MASVLVYTSPARGHLFPILGVALELGNRGHAVHVRTLAPEVEKVRSLGLHAEPIADAIEARELDDWRASNPLAALDLAMKTFADRAAEEVDDVRAALSQTAADALIVDTNCWGAQAVAEASGLPWAVFQPYFTFLPARGVPPFGPGLARATGPLGRIRDAVVRRLVFSQLDRVALPGINHPRARLRLAPLGSIAELPLRPPRVLYFTAEPLEYPRRQWPSSFRLVGPSTWGHRTATPRWLKAIERPIALVTCSTELQSDRQIIDTAMQALPRQGLFVVATSAAHTAEDFADASMPHGRVERFVPHDAVLERARVVVCHGGMGITQRALAHGVPVVVVPFGRDQLEVARRVEHARAGVRLMPRRLNRASLTAAVARAETLRDGAQRVANAFANAGGCPAATDAFEELLDGGASANPTGSSNAFHTG